MNCLGILAFIRDPVPPARIRKPVLPKPLNSASLVTEEESVVGEEARTEVVAVTEDREIIEEMAALLDAAGRNAAENGSSNRNWSHSIDFIMFGDDV